MRSRRAAMGALLMTSTISSSNSFVCRACLASAKRQFNASSLRNAEDNRPWYTKMKDNIFGRQDGREKKKALVSASSTSVAKDIQPYEDVSYMGKRYTIARAKETADYVAAASEEELGHIDLAKRHAAPVKNYTGYMPAYNSVRSAMTDQLWEKLLKFTAQEALILHEGKDSPADICTNLRKSQPRLAEHFYFSTKAGELELEVGATSKAQIWLLPKYTRANTSNLDNPSNQRQTAPREAQAGEDGDWANMYFPTPMVKFAIVKRVMQLSGHRISDRMVSEATTLGALYDAFRGKDKPKRLAQSPVMEELNASMPNVTVYETKRTPMQREEEIGRRKLILNELELRGLMILRDDKVQPRQQSAAA